MLPLFAIYECGLFLVNGGAIRNAADVLLKGLLGLETKRQLLLLHGAVMLVFLGAALWPHRPRRRVAISWSGRLGLVILESTVYALAIVPVVRFAGNLAPLARPNGRTLVEELLLGVGAGLYEEIVFRLLPLGLLLPALVTVLHIERVSTATLAILISSLVFSWYHHWGGAPFTADVFVFRFLAGVFLGLLFTFRGFAIAVWTHVLYDEFCWLLS